MRIPRLGPLLPAISLFSWISGQALAAALPVDLKNESAMAVSVPIGTDNAVGADNDFLVAADNGSVAIYPQELFRNRFWSQPLSEEDFARIRTGMEAAPAAMDQVTRAVIRAKGEARRAEILARQREARRQFLVRKIEDLRSRREALMERRDALDERIAAEEKLLVDEEGRMEWTTSVEDERIDRALQAIQDLGDRRDELQARREEHSRTSSRSDFARQSTEAAHLSDRIAAERDAIREARDRKRSARSAYLSRKQEWQKLVAERRELRSGIRAVDQKIQDLEAKK